LRRGLGKFISRGRIHKYVNERRPAKALFQPQQTLSYGSLGSKRD